MKFVTVASYNMPVQAEVAKNVLESAGIKAFLVNLEIVSMELLLTNAVGGVKLQVMSEDVTQAREVLMEVYGNPEGILTEPVDQDELARQAMAATPDDQEEPPVDATQALSSEKPQVESPAAHQQIIERDEYAQRFFRASLFGLILVWLTPYCIYLFLNATFGSGPISSRGWLKLLSGSFFFLLHPMIWVCFAGAYLLWFS